MLIASAQVRCALNETSNRVVPDGTREHSRASRDSRESKYGAPRLFRRESAGSSGLTPGSLSASGIELQPPPEESLLEACSKR